MLFPNGAFCEARVSNESDRAAVYRLRTTNGQNWVDIDGYLETGAPVLVVFGTSVGAREIYYVLSPRGLVWMSSEHLSRTTCMFLSGGRVIPL